MDHLGIEPNPSVLQTVARTSYTNNPDESSILLYTHNPHDPRELLENSLFRITSAVLHHISIRGICRSICRLNRLATKFCRESRHRTDLSILPRDGCLKPWSFPENKKPTSRLTSGGAKRIYVSKIILSQYHSHTIPSSHQTVWVVGLADAKKIVPWMFSSWSKSKKNFSIYQIYHKILCRLFCWSGWNRTNTLSGLGIYSPSHLTNR